MASLVSLESIVHESDNEAIMPFIPKNTRRLLDIGCGSGLLGARIKAAFAECEVVGVTISEAEAQACSGRLDSAFVRDLTKEGLSDLGIFDCVVCSHAIGYFHDLHRILGEIRGVLASEGVFVVAIPNIVHWKQRLEFVKGHFRYNAVGGQLHYYYARFFDYEMAGSFLRDADYEIVARDTDGYLPMPLLRKLLGQSRARKVDKAMARRFPGLLGSEFILVARPTTPAPRESRT